MSPLPEFIQRNPMNIYETDKLCNHIMGNFYTK